MSSIRLSRKFVLVGLAAVLLWSAPLRPSAAQEVSTGTILYETAVFPGLGPSDIYSLGADGTNNRALTHDGLSVRPSWSPDGQRVVFVREELMPAPAHPEVSVRTPANLFVMNQDGTDQRLIRRLGFIDSAAWSPDGKAFAVSYRPPNGRLSVYLLPVDGGRDQRLLLANAIEPAWSPDGKKIAAVQEDGSWKLTIIDIDGSNETVLAEQTDSPAWSPDGKEMAFGARRGGPGNVRPNEQQIFIANLADGGQTVRQLTNDPLWSFCENPTWSPDGNRIAFSCHTEGCFVALEWGPNSPPRVCMSRIFVIAADGTNPQLIPLIQHDGAFPTFAPK